MDDILHNQLLHLPIFPCNYLTFIAYNKNPPYNEKQSRRFKAETIKNMRINQKPIKLKCIQLHSVFLQVKTK